MTDMPLALYPQGLYDVRPLPTPPPPPHSPSHGRARHAVAAPPAVQPRAALPVIALRASHARCERPRGPRRTSASGAPCAKRARAPRAARGASRSRPPAAVGRGAAERARTGKVEKTSGGGAGCYPANWTATWLGLG